MHREKIAKLQDKEEQLEKALLHIRAEQERIILLLKNPNDYDVQLSTEMKELTEINELKKVINELRDRSLQNLEEQIKHCIVTCHEQLLAEEHQIGRKLYQLQLEKQLLLSTV
ncbi:MULTISPECIES: hypothetical protein [Listeria]|uniref:hypothetical protein n=1 Tax=Listeria TaxID=1637 RepID=UPI000B590065|nr:MULTISPECIES: hypothetical protein [Listeria]